MRLRFSQRPKRSSRRAGGTGKEGAAAHRRQRQRRPPQGRVVYGWHVAEGRADIFLTYCTNALVAQKENPGQQLVALPEALSVGADYGLTVVSGASAAAQEFAEFILSAEGQKILASYGFAPGQ